MDKRVVKGVLGQWHVVLVFAGDEGDMLEKYRLHNPDEQTGKSRYYAVEPGKYGEPRIKPEPELAFNWSDQLSYVDGEGNETKPDAALKISGIVCKDGPRFSLTNAQRQGIHVKPLDDGSIMIGDDAWWPSTLFLKDKNRNDGYDAFCVRQKPDVTRVLELGDLDLF